MHSFKEVVARLVIVANVVIIVETRARYIYQPGPFIECQKHELPCGGRTEGSCNDYCEESGFSRGSCNGHCCLCFARPHGMLHLVPPPMQHSVVSGSSTPTTLNQLLNSLKITPVVTTRTNDAPHISQEERQPKPKRSASLPDSIVAVRSNLLVEEQSTKEKPVISDSISDICLTPDCVKTANAILENINEDVSPCDDFYQFTCGNFQKDVRIPDDKGAVTLMGSINDKLTEQLRELLEAPETSPHSAQLAKTLYDSCMDVDRLEKSGVQPLRNLFGKVGGWPVLEKNWDSATWNWENAVGIFRKNGLITDYLLKTSVVPDLKNPSFRTLYIGEPVLSFKREQLQHPHFAQSYQRFQENVAKLLGADGAKASSDMAQVFKFERTLANISLPRELSRAHPLTFYHPMKISQLQKLHPTVNWLAYIQALLPENIDIDEDQIVNVHSPEHLSVLLQTIDKTEKRTLANYLMWRTAAAVLPYLNEQAIRLQHQFVGVLSGKLQRKPRWRECIDTVTKTLGQAVGAMYVRKHFDEASKGIAIEMVEDIQKAFVEILSEMKWMDPETKQKAFDKAAAMKTLIGYPQELLVEENLENLFKGLELSKTSFFGNLLNLTKGSTNHAMGKLKEPVNKNDWIQFGKPAMVNAFYQPITNSIQFPAGILQGHFFNKDRPSFMNYGAIGWVIGHEITHGYDDQGSHFDLNGELRDWWNPVTKHHFHGKAKCLVDQYSSFKYTDVARNVTLPINGVISVGENIADNGGIKQAYKGYQSWVKRNGVEKKLPGLKYTPNQLFWISAASNWCSKVRPQQMIESIQMGVHSPGEYRVRGTFANMEQFSKDFSCPVGSPMNPPTKCQVW